MNSSRRADGLDGLRGLAAAAIVLLHVWMFSGAHQPWQPERTDQIVGALGLSLMMFFVLSGLLIATPWVRASEAGRPAPDVARYAVRRAARVVPGYLVCVAVAFFLMRAIEHPLAITAGELPAFLLFAQNQFTATAGQLNPPLWSLGVEITFYLVMPLVGLGLIAALRRAGATGAAAICVALVAVGLTWAAYAYAAGSPPTLVNALPTYLPIFACGIAAAVVAQRRTFGPGERAALLVGGAILAVADGWWHAEPTGAVGHVIRDLPAGVGFAMIAVAVMQGRARILGSLPLRRLGEYSFGIYLWHMPVLYVLRHHERWPESPWEAYALVLAIATVLGALSWYLVERPAIAWAARRTPRPAPPSKRPARPAPIEHQPALRPAPAAGHDRRAHRPAAAPRHHVAWGTRHRGPVGDEHPPVVLIRPIHRGH